MTVNIDKGIPEGSLTIKVLSTNETSSTVLTDEKFIGKVVQPQSSAAGLLGEHGLALGISIKDPNGAQNILLDAGGLKATTLGNAAQLNFPIDAVDTFILSHGHVDHWGGMKDVFGALSANTKVIISPDAYGQQHIAVTKGGETIPADEFATNYRALKKAGTFSFDVKLPAFPEAVVKQWVQAGNLNLEGPTGPIKFHEGATTSGPIKLFDENEITRGFYKLISRKEAEKCTFRDETALYFNIQGKGLVVVTGCGHCGIINTIKHGQELTGISQIYAVIGGFHEEWTPEPKLKDKIDQILAFKPEIVCGMHCTGFAFNAMIQGHPSHAYGIVGTEFRL